MSYPKHLFAASVAMLVMGMAATATAQDSASSAAAQPATQPMEPSKTAELLMSDNDQKFMATAASAGMYEVQASQLALQKSDDPKQKAFAQMMIDDHTKAGDELKDLASKKNVTLPTALASADQSMLDTLNQKDAGKDFDKAYRSQMQKSHKKAVSLFDNEARHGKDAEVKTWAASTLPKLKHHGGMANALPKVS